MISRRDFDLTELERIWNKRRAALRDILSRIDTRGMKRPARDPDERAWLQDRNAGSVFIEDEGMAVQAREYYARKYSREEP